MLAVFFRLDDVRDFLLHYAAGEACLTSVAVGDGASSEGEKRVVVANPDILAGLYLSAALADDNHAGTRRCAVSELNSEVFRV